MPPCLLTLSHAVTGSRESTVWHAPSSPGSREPSLSYWGWRKEMGAPQAPGCYHLFPRLTNPTYDCPLNSYSNSEAKIQSSVRVTVCKQVFLNKCGNTWGRSTLSPLALVTTNCLLLLLWRCLSTIKLFESGHVSSEERFHLGSIRSGLYLHSYIACKISAELLYTYIQRNINLKVR